MRAGWRAQALARGVPVGGRIQAARAAGRTGCCAPLSPAHNCDCDRDCVAGARAGACARGAGDAAPQAHARRAQGRGQGRVRAGGEALGRKYPCARTRVCLRVWRPARRRAGGRARGAEREGAALFARRGLRLVCGAGASWIAGGSHARPCWGLCCRQGRHMARWACRGGRRARWGGAPARKNRAAVWLTRPGGAARAGQGGDGRRGARGRRGAPPPGARRRGRRRGRQADHAAAAWPALRSREAR